MITNLWPNSNSIRADNAQALKIMPVPDINPWAYLRTFCISEKTLDKARPRLEKDNLRDNKFSKVKSPHPPKGFI